MTKTEYLYGVNPDKYRKLQTELCNLKIKDAQILKANLRMQGNTKEIQERYLDVDKAIEWNRQLLNELND